MAQEIIVRLVDDLDGSEAAGTVKFAYDGVHYEIDLNETNRAKMDRALATFIKAARRTGGRQVAGSKRPSKAAQIREWAIGKGMEISPSGKIPKSVVQAYEAEHSAA